MSPFIVVVVLCACTWVVARAATQPVEPATAGAAPAREGRRHRTKVRPEPIAPPPPAPLPEVAAPLLLTEPPAAAPVLAPFAPPTLAPEFAPPEPDEEHETGRPAPGDAPAPGGADGAPTEADDPAVDLDVEVDGDATVEDDAPGRPGIGRRLGARSGFGLEDLRDTEVDEDGEPVRYPQLDPGVPLQPTPLGVRVRAASTLVAIAVALGVGVAVGIGLLFVVLFVLVRSAFG